MAGQVTRIGRYEIIRELGHGGMGTVFLARDPAIERLVAIKLLREGFDSDELRARFAREARSAGKLRHPNIVTIFDAGEDAGRPFIAMEYIPGETLAEIIRRRPLLDLDRKLELIADMCAGLDFAHKAQIVHRDIKPANVIVDAQGALKILDFGIARVEQSGLTEMGGLVGTLNYMSPEQLAGQPTGLSCDVWAVGAVFYELVTYQQAFPGGIADGILNRIMNGTLTPPGDLCPGLPSAVARIIARSLEKEPQRRYPDLAEMRFELTRALGAVEDGATGDVTAPITPMPVRKTPSGPGTDRRGTDRALLAKRRAEQIEAHLLAARRAFEAGDFVEAINCCEQAATLDPDHPLALDLMDRARAALDEQQIRHLASEARERVRDGALTASRDLLEQARALVPSLSADSPAIADLERARLELNRAYERAERVRTGLQRARAAFARQDLESAIRHAAELLAVDPGVVDAQQLLEQAKQALDRRREEEEARRRGKARRAALESQLALARRHFADGNFADAREIVRGVVAQDATHQGARRLDSDIEAAEARALADQTVIHPVAPLPVLEDPPKPAPGPSSQSGRRADVFPPPPPRASTPALTRSTHRAEPSGHRTLAAAAAFVLVIVAVGVYAVRQYMGSGASVAPPPPDLALSTTTAGVVDPTVVTTTSTPVDMQSVLTTTTATSAARAPVDDRERAAQHAALRTQAVEEWRRGNRLAAIRTLAAFDPNDRESVRVLNQFVEEARTLSANAGRDARDANASGKGVAEYERAEENERQAILAAAAQPQQAARLFVEAAGLFTKAAAQAREQPAVATGPAIASTSTLPEAPQSATTTPSVAQAPVVAPATTSGAEPSSPPAAPASPDAAIRQVLGQFTTAYERLDAAGVKAIFPSIDARALSELFSQYSTLTQTIEIAHINVAADARSATVSASVTTAPVLKTGRAPAQRRLAEFRLKQTGAAWLIENVMLR